MAATRSLGSMQISIPGPTKKYPGRLGRWKYPRVETSSVPSESTDTIHVNTELDELRLRYIQLGSKYIKLQEEKELREKESLNQVRALEKVLVKNNKQLQQARATYVSLQKRYQEQCTLSEMYRGDLRAREERIRSLTDEAHMFETEIIRLRSENEQHPKHRDKVDPPGLPISGLKQVVAGEGMTTHVKCTCLASELNLSASATNLDTSANSAEDQPVSVLANTRDANTSLLTFDDVSAGKQTHQITLNGDGQGMMNELSDKMKKLDDEREHQNITTLSQSTAGDRSVVKGETTPQAPSDVHINPELEELRLRYTQLESEYLALMSTREHDQADRQQLDSVTVQVESVATEFSNGSTTNPAAESSSAEHQPVSMLPNTREANLNHCNVSAAKEIYHVTMNGDTRLLQGSIDELFAEMKIFKNERDRLQEENRMLQEKAQDRVRRQGVFSAPYRDNRLQEQQPQVISRREKLLRKLLCLG